MISSTGISNTIPHARVTSFTPLSRSLSRRDLELDAISLYISHNLFDLNPFLDNVKRGLNEDNHAVWYQRPGQARLFSIVLNLSRMLNQAGLLRQLSVEPTSWIDMTILNSPEAVGFLSGLWLERSLRMDLIQMQPTFGAMNIHLVLEDGGSAELDAIAGWGGNRYWFEATTGDVRTRELKLDVLHEDLGIPRRNCLVVTSGYRLPSDPASSVRYLWELPTWLSERLYKVRIPGQKAREHIRRSPMLLRHRMTPSWRRRIS